MGYGVVSSLTECDMKGSCLVLRVLGIIKVKLLTLGLVPTPFLITLLGFTKSLLLLFLLGKI